MWAAVRCMLRMEGGATIAALPPAWRAPAGDQPRRLVGGQGACAVAGMFPCRRPVAEAPGLRCSGMGNFGWDDITPDGRCVSWRGAERWGGPGILRRGDGLIVRFRWLGWRLPEKSGWGITREAGESESCRRNWICRPDSAACAGFRWFGYRLDPNCLDVADWWFKSGNRAGSARIMAGFAQLRRWR